MPSPEVEEETSVGFFFLRFAPPESEELLSAGMSGSLSGNESSPLPLFSSVDDSGADLRRGGSADLVPVIVVLVAVGEGVR